MIYKVKDIKDTGMTKSGLKMTKVVLEGEDGKTYNVTIFNETVFKGDEVDGTMGQYNEKYKNYSFRLNSVKHTSNSQKGTSDDERQSNIAFESFYSSSCNLLQKSGDVGEAIAVAWQLHHYLTKKEWVMLCTADQRKSIVAKLGSIDIARAIIYQKYKKPYLHLLTYEEAQEILREA